MGRRKGEPLIPDGCRLAIFTHRGKLYDAILFDYEDHELLVRSGMYEWKGGDSMLGDAKIWRLETWVDWAGYGKCLRLRDEMEAQRGREEASRTLFEMVPGLGAILVPMMGMAYYAMQQVLGKVSK